MSRPPHSYDDVSSRSNFCLMDNAIEIEGLVKTFGPTRALDGLDPLMEATFRACVEEDRERGRTVTLPGMHDLRVDGDRVRFEVDPDSLDGARRALTATGVRSLVSHPPTLEELFLRPYQIESAAPSDGPGEAAGGTR